MSTQRYYAGFGCRRGCSADSLRQLLEQALHDHDLPLAQIAGIASIDTKSDEIGLQTLAKQLNIPLLFFSAQQLLAYQDRLSEQSAITLRITGASSVAEASALALAEQQSGRPPTLIINKRKNADATFALAAAAINTQEQR